MANEGWNIVVDKKIAIQDALKNVEDLSTRSTEDLQSFFDEYKNWNDFGAVAALATELAKRAKTENLTPSTELQKKLAEDAQKESQKTEEFNKQITVEKTEEDSSKQDKISELTAKLNDSEKNNSLEKKVWSLEEKMNKLLEVQEKSREPKTKIIENILKAKRSGNIESKNKLVNELLLIKQENETLEAEIKTLKAEIKWEKLKYPEWKIRELRTRRIGWGITKFGLVPVKKWKKFEVQLEGLRVVRNLHSRRKINKTIRKFNEIKDDPKAAVKYIMSKTKNRYWWAISAIIKWWYNHLTIRDTKKFDEVFNKQKEQFIDDLFWNFGENITDRDKKIKESIIRRVEYYQDTYKKTIVTI